MFIFPTFLFSYVTSGIGYTRRTHLVDVPTTLVFMTLPRAMQPLRPALTARCIRTVCHSFSNAKVRSAFQQSHGCDGGKHSARLMSTHGLRSLNAPTAYARKGRVLRQKRDGNAAIVINQPT